MTLQISTCIVIERTILITNIVFSVVAILLKFLDMFYFKQDNPRKNLLNPCLRTFTNITVPVTYIVPVATIAGAVGYLEAPETQTFDICRMIQAFGGNLMRAILVVQCVDRIIATIFLKKYQEFSNQRIAILVAWVCICMCVFLALTPTIIPTDTYSLRAAVALIVHILCAIATFFLIRQNLTFHKALNSRYHLTNRYQIVENIRILRYIMPNIVIMTFIAALGPLTNKIFVNLTDRPYASNGFFYVSYILYFIITSIVEINRKKKKNIVYSGESSIPGDQNQKFIISALGTKLPGGYSGDMYFKQMNTMWK